MSNGNKDVVIEMHGAHRGDLTQNQSKYMIGLHGWATVPNVGHEAAIDPIPPTAKRKDTAKVEERKAQLLTANLPEINGQEQQLGG